MRSKKQESNGFRNNRKRTTAGLLLGAVGAVFAAQAVASTPALAAPVAAAPALQPCSASYIGVPGSGQTSTSSAEMTDLGAQLQADAASAGQQLRKSTILSYPAVPWYQYAAPGMGLNVDNLDKSEAQGAAILTVLISSDRAAAAAAGCPDAPILVAGYSQGAEVVVRGVDALSPTVRNTVSVALLGNPSFTPGAAGDLDLNSAAYEGIRPAFFSGQRYTLTSDVLSRTIDICAASDPICAYSQAFLPGLVTGTSPHYQYTTLTYNGITLVNDAANFLWSHRG